MKILISKPWFHDLGKQSFWSGGLRGIAEATQAAQSDGVSRQHRAPLARGGWRKYLVELRFALLQLGDYGLQVLNHGFELGFAHAAGFEGILGGRHEGLGLRSKGDCHC